METSALTFAQPAWFAALLLVPIFAALYYWSQRRSDALISKIIAPRLKAELAGSISIGRRAAKAVLIILALALVVAALARPQFGFIEREVKQRGRDVIIAIDTSRSMLATDVAPTRLARAKLVAQDLMNLVPGDRVGLIAFAGSSFLQAPLTLDHSAVINSLAELDTSIIPKGGTDIASAINQAIDAFGKGEGLSRALIILTDGEELDEDGVAAAKKAGELGIRIFTVGIGSAAGSLIPIVTSSGGNDFVRDENGKPVQSRLDEARLKEIAGATGGFYVPLSSDAAKEIYDHGIQPMQETEAGEMTSRQPIERYQWPLGAAIFLIALWSILGDRRRPLRPLRPALVLLLLAAVSPARAETGFEEYQAGQYNKAATDFARGLQQAPDSSKLQYDAGAAAYKTGDYPKAVDHFTKALLADDSKLREDASYNLANALVRRGESAQETDQKKSDWKNAIQHYTEAINLDSKNKNAIENRDIVKKLLDDLDKQQKQQDQKNQNQQKQDQKDQKDQKDNKQQQNSQQQNQDNKDQQKQNQNQQQNQQHQQNQSQQNKDQSGQNQQNQNQSQKNQDQQNKDQQNKSNPSKGNDQQKGQPTPTPTPTPTPQPASPDNKNGQQPPQSPQNQPQQQGGQSPQDQSQSPGATPTPGPKKQGDLKPNGQDQKNRRPSPRRNLPAPVRRAQPSSRRTAK